jgi:hypothetical protein
MIKITFTEPTDEAWKAWREKCRVEQEKLNASYEDDHPIPVTDLYKAMKAVYLGLHGPFHGKCAYCESLIAENQPGDIDHFRPKGRLRTHDLEEVMISGADGKEEPHAGYYWLAYDWRNLLPACIDCNRPSTQKTPGKRIGKWDHFPVEDETVRASRPGEEGLESPLLLNPADPTDDPSRHLAIDESGIFSWSTPQGEKTVETFGLNDREALIKSRMKVYRDVINLILSWINTLHLDATAPAHEIEQEIHAYRDGSEPFSAVGRVAIRDALRRHGPFFELYRQCEVGTPTAG